MALFRKDDAGEERFDDYSNLSLQQTDEAKRVNGSRGPAFHVENELDAFGREQRPLFTAEGIVAGREAYVEREGLDARRSSGREIANGDMQLVEQARDHLVRARRALGPHVRRKSGQKEFFTLRTGLLFLGDVVGQAGAQIYAGEVPELALMQSVASGTAVVTAGLVGSEAKDLRMVAKRRLEKDQLSKSQLRFATFFIGEDDGKRYVKVIVITAGCVGALISGGILALRAFVDNPLSGIVYGAFAGGIAIASFISSYVHADEAADLIDRAEADYEKSLKRQTLLAASAPLAKGDSAGALYESIKDEYAFRGEAAQLTHEGLKHRVLRRNPGIAGHSPAEDPEPTIGSRPRPSEGEQ